MRHLSHARLTLISVVLIGATVFVNTLDKGMNVPISVSLDTFPRQIGEWTFLNSRSLPERVEDKLGVDDYLEWDYVSPAGNVANLYVSYFSSMEGKGFHSPRNCMPGAGWDVASLNPLVLETHHSKKAEVEINEMILQKGIERQVVLYWYQCRGRFVRSEYMEKMYQVLDSILKRRTDGAFIRIMAPVRGIDTDHTTKHLAGFAEQVIPILDQYVPGS
jgi:EpsI family protein